MQQPSAVTVGFIRVISEACILIVIFCLMIFHSFSAIATKTSLGDHLLLETLSGGLIMARSASSRRYPMTTSFLCLARSMTSKKFSSSSSRRYRSDCRICSSFPCRRVQMQGKRLAMLMQKPDKSAYCRLFETEENMYVYSGKIVRYSYKILFSGGNDL